MDNGSSCGNKNKDLNWRGMLEFWRTMYQTLLFYLSRKTYPFFSRSCSSPAPAVWFRVDWDAAMRSLPTDLLLQGARLTKGPSGCTLKPISKFAWRPRLPQAAPASHWVWQEYQGRSVPERQGTPISANFLRLKKLPSSFAEPSRACTAI